MVQLSHLYMPTGRTIALTIWTFVGKMMPLLFNMLVTAFLPRSKCLLISWLQSLSAVILESKKIKSATPFTFSLLFTMKTGWHDLGFLMLSFKSVFSLSCFILIKSTTVLSQGTAGNYIGPWLDHWFRWQFFIPRWQMNQSHSWRLIKDQ